MNGILPAPVVMPQAMTRRLDVRIETWRAGHARIGEQTQQRRPHHRRRAGQESLGDEFAAGPRPRVIRMTQRLVQTQALGRFLEHK